MTKRQIRNTAAILLSLGQAWLLAFLAVGIAVEVLLSGGYTVLRGVVAAITLFYVLFVGLKLLLWAAASTAPLPTLTLPSPNDDSLPWYTIMVPLYKEAEVVPRLVGAIDKLHYPKGRLQVLLLAEEDDAETVAAIQAAHPPHYFELVLVPNAGPRTKPKACDYGYMRAVGEYVVIFDAEDRPDPDQLLKAVAQFRASPANVGCLQAALSFWNPRHSWVSTFYFAEYLVHFRFVIRGLARLRLIPPLGGTSNHFRKDALDTIALENGTWAFTTPEGDLVELRGFLDPHNQTEDADLAGRLRLSGYGVAILDSTTLEEAPHSLRKAKNQRSRWLLGYLQTGLVHTRRPFWRIRRYGFVSWASYNLLMLGTPFSLLLNPITWATTALYITSRLEGWVGVSEFIRGLFPPPIYYPGMVVAVAGNVLLFFQKFVAVVRQQEQDEQQPWPDALGAHMQEEQYGTTFRLFFTPLWWAFTSMSAYRALRKLLLPKQRYVWDLSTHGHALQREAELEEVRAAQILSELPQEG